MAKTYEYKYVTGTYTIVEPFEMDVQYRDIGPIEREEMERCDDIEYRIETERMVRK